MNNHRLVSKIAAVISAIFVVASSMLKPYSLLVSIILMILALAIIVALGIWNIILIIRDEDPKEEASSKNNPRWANVCFGVAAIVIIVGAFFKINHWSGGTFMVLIGMIAGSVVTISNKNKGS